MKEIIADWRTTRVGPRGWTELHVRVYQTPKGPELSITGAQGAGTRPSEASTYSCGCIHETLAVEFPKVIPHLPFHLNGMRAGCPHQKGWHICPGHLGNVEPCPGGRRLNAAERIHYRVDSSYPRRWQCSANRLGHPCPTCGHCFGTAWLYEPLPKETLEWAMNGGVK